MNKQLLFLYLLILAFLSLNPWVRPSDAKALGFVAWDKISHALAYGLLTILINFAFPKQARGRYSLIISIVTAAGIGIFAEYCQAWLTSTRSFSWLDASANGLGAVTGAAGYWVYQALSGIIRQSWKNA
ncbi:VanZ family protein [Methylomagnum sp.]